VPLGSRVVVGVVWDAQPGDDTATVPDAKLKPIHGRLDAPRMPEVSRRFVDRVARYAMSAPGAVLRMAMSVADALDEPPQRKGLVLAAAAPSPILAEPGGPRIGPARARVLAIAADGVVRRARALASEAGVSAAVLRGMVERGWLVEAPLPEEMIVQPGGMRPGSTLSADQRGAADALAAALNGGFSATLLDGVTGSGKTEVYFEAIAACLARQRQALVLLPEIAMSAQFLARFEARFGAPPTAWHSELPHRQRVRNWRDIAAGRARVVVGARSALFLPFPELGLIIVDEEHEQAFKQEEGVVYHARDMAVLRAHLGGHPVVLVSATPSLETVVNVERGRYRSAHLPDRHGGAQLPQVELVDLRRDAPPPRAWLSPPLRAALAETLDRGEQAMLFLNRRGYAPLTLCRACGHRLQCPNCTAWLVEHRLAGRLQCHHCGHSDRVPQTCPSCAAEGRFAPCGPGVERVAEEARTLFPTARLDLITSDTIGGPHSAGAFVERMVKHEVDLLVGTQIVAKGHHFPALTLVGVVDADLGLAGGDLRAGERTFQLLQQVAGRAGRAERPGRVLVQTHEPRHPAMIALAKGDRAGFYASERAARERYGLPPYGRLAALIVSGPDSDAVDRYCRAIARDAPGEEGIETLGPAPAPLAMLRGRHRRRFLVKATREIDLHATLRAWLSAHREPGSIRLQIDIDPYSFM
jgi:primosomal protein N' (replication factor Y)